MPKNEADPSNGRTKPTTLQTVSTNPVDESNISSSSPPIVKANPHESDAIHRFINEKAKQQVDKPDFLDSCPKKLYRFLSKIFI